MLARVQDGLPDPYSRLCSTSTKDAAFKGGFRVQRI